MRDVTASGGERRWTAVLMADMAGSTAITERIGTEKAYQMLTRLIAMAVAAVEHEGGTALTFGGDSLLASFGAPVAVEEASLRACRAALAFQAAIAGEADRLEARFGIRPQFRIGISGGMVVVGHLGPNAGMDLNIMGQPVNTASRLQELAQPGQILLSEAMFEQVEGEVAYTPLGPQHLKGIGGTTNIYALLKTLDAKERFAGRIRRGLVDMVGRREPLRHLHRALNQKDIGWRFMLVQGPPGIGKSRLLHDLRFALQGERRVFQGQCRSGSQAPYKPIADILIAASQVDPAEGADAVLSGLQQVVGADLVLDPLRQLLAHESGAKPSPADDNFALTLRHALHQVLLRLYAQFPTLLVIEDAHWIDGASQALISEMLAKPVTQACPFLITSRPEGVPIWSDQRDKQLIVLETLSEAETRELASRRLRSATLSQGFSGLLYEKSEGNPLFIEEILRYLGSTDALIETGDGLGIREGSALDLAGGNLQHLVMARVDGLPSNLRQTLRYAAVQGRQFSQRVLEHIERDKDLTPALSEAADRGLIQPDPNGRKGQWQFSHALLRDAIYGSLLEDTRLPMHRIVGEALEKAHAGRTDDICETLAYHFEAAELPRPASAYLIRAAHKALRLYDLTEVDRQLLKVRDMLRADMAVVSQDDLDGMIVVWLEAMNFKGNFARVIEIGHEFLPALRKGGNERAEEIAVSHYATALTHARDYGQAIALAEQGIRQATQRGDRLSAAWLHLPLLRAFEETACVDSATFIKLSEAALSTAKELGEVRLQMQLVYLQAAHFRSYGYIARARERNVALRTLATTQNDKRGQGFASWSETLMFQVSDEIERAIALAERSLPLTVPGTADAHVLLSLWAANVVLGPDPRAARSVLDRMMALSRDYLDYNLIQGNGLIDAIYHLRLGQVALGWDRLCHVLEDTRTSGNVTFSRYFHLVRAEILLMIGGLLKEPPPFADLPDRRVTPPPKPGLKDIATALRLRFQARRLAQQDLAYFRDHFRGDGTGAVEARCQVCEALLQKDRGRRQAGLQAAIQLAQAEGLKILEHRIKAQL